MYNTVVRAATNVEKCITLLETTPKVVDREGAVPLQVSEQDISSKTTGELVFNNVSFRYKTDNGSIGGLRNVSFTVSPGRTLGIVGPSGTFRTNHSLLSYCGILRATYQRLPVPMFSLSHVVPAVALLPLTSRSGEKVRGQKYEYLFEGRTKRTSLDSGCRI